MPIRLTESEASRIAGVPPRPVDPERSARAKAARKVSERSKALLIEQIRTYLPNLKLQPELRFHDTREWRFDLAAPYAMLAIEIEGGAFSRGKSRHTTGTGFVDDCDKYAFALLLGWRVLRVPTDWVWNGRAAALFVAAANPKADWPSPLPPRKRRRRIGT
jgi:very-short-patch-repair endonuclease